MYDPPPDPPLVPTPAGPPPPSPDRPDPRRRWIVLVAVAAAAMLVGAAIATSAFLLLDSQPRHQYAVSVFLAHDITDEQRAALQASLTALDPVDGVRFESREEAWRQFQEMFRDRPDLIASTEADSLPESFRLTTAGESFDCAALAPVRELAGVAEIVVVELPTGDRPGAPVACP